MMFRKWNADWEKPDPLRNRRGWGLQHYVGVAVALGAFVLALGFLLPAVMKARHKTPKLPWFDEELLAMFVVGAGGSVGAR